MKLTLAVSVVVSACTLSACLPAPYGAYYRPAYPDDSSKLSKAYCGGQAGPPAHLRFSGPEGLLISVSALRGYVDRDRTDWPLRIAISLPPGTRLQFQSDQLGLAATASAPPRTLPVELRVSTSTTLDAQDWVDYAEHGPTPVAAAQAYLAAHLEQALAQVSWPAPDVKGFVPDAVSIELPAIESAGQIHAWPRVDLLPITSRSGSRIYRNQAYSDELQASQARCERDTPKLHCENIVSLDPYALNVASGPFTYKGRTWVWDTAQKSPFSSSYELSARSTARWRLPSPMLRYRDTASGELHDSVFTTMHVSWHVQVPLATPIQAAQAGKQPSTSLLIHASLGEARAPHYYISLPPMLINGQPYTLKPIELELRLLDGGIEPFNC